MSREETAGSTEMAFGMWGAVGLSNHILDKGPHPPWLGAILGNFLPIEKHWHCMLPSIHRVAHDMCRSPAKDAEAIRRVRHRI